MKVSAVDGNGMVRTALTAVAVVAAGIVLPATAAAADGVATPTSVGMLPAASPPEAPDESPVAPLLQAAGIALLLAGGVTVARGWVSPDPAV